MFELRLIADVFGSLCEIVLINHFFASMLSRSPDSKIIYAIVNAAGLVLLSIVTLLPNFQWIIPFFIFALIFLLSFLYQKKWYVRIFYSVILYLLLALSETIVGALSVMVTGIDIGNVRDHYLLYTMGLLASKLLSFLLIRIIRYLRPGVYNNVPFKVFLGLMLTPLSSIAAIYTIGINLRNYEGWPIMTIVLFTSILLCISNFFVFYLFENQMKNEQTRAKLIFAEKQIGLQIDYYKDMSERQSEIRTLSHDLKHYLSGLWGFMQEGNLDEAKRCIAEILADLTKSDSVFDTGHPALDAILQLKKHRMDDGNIRFESYIALPAQISIDILDLCVILGNALDNAIEACENLPDGQERYIRLVMSLQSKYISISIENPSTLSALSDDSLPTTKSDSYYHGLGLESIRALTNKHDGSLSVSCANHIFKLAAMVKND